MIKSCSALLRDQFRLNIISSSQLIGVLLASISSWNQFPDVLCLIHRASDFTLGFTHVCMHARDFMIRTDAQKTRGSGGGFDLLRFYSKLTYRNGSFPDACVYETLGFASCRRLFVSGWSKYADNKFERGVSPYAEASRDCSFLLLFGPV